MSIYNVHLKNPSVDGISSRKDILRADLLDKKAAQDKLLKSEVLPTNSFSSVATEELTFQFSEIIEARETALENRLFRDPKIDNNERLGLKEIQSFLEFVDGKQAYSILQSQAAVFARLYLNNKEVAHRYLEIEALPYEKRFALLTIAADLINASSAHYVNTNDFNGLIKQQKNPFFSKEIDAILAALDANKSSGFQDRKSSLFDVVVLNPTIRSLWTLFIEKSGENMQTYLLQVAKDLNGRHERLIQDFGTIVIALRTIGTIKSMHSNAHEFVMRLGIVDLPNDHIVCNYTKSFIELGQSSMPSTHIDKIVDGVKSANRKCPHAVINKERSYFEGSKHMKLCDCNKRFICLHSESRRYILSLLYWYARRWPSGVWINEDAKHLVLEQLIKKQNAPTGLAAKRLMF